MVHSAQYVFKSSKKDRKTKPEHHRQVQGHASTPLASSASAASERGNVMSLSYIAPATDSDQRDQKTIAAAKSLLTLQSGPPTPQKPFETEVDFFTPGPAGACHIPTVAPYKCEPTYERYHGEERAQFKPFWDVAPETQVKYRYGNAGSETSSDEHLSDESKQSAAESPSKGRRDPRPEYTTEQKLFIGHRRIIKNLTWQEVQAEFPLWFPENRRSDSGLNSIYYRFRQDPEQKGGLGIGKCKDSDISRDREVLEARCHAAGHPWLRRRRFIDRNGDVVMREDM